MAPECQVKDRRPLKVVIVGGSLAGLMQGIVLKRLGHNVRILERHNESIRPSHGAGITAKEHVQGFFLRHDLTKTPLFISSACRQYLNRDGDIVRTQAWPIGATSWSLLYLVLRSGFDGLRSSCCNGAEVLEVQGAGSAVHDHGQRVTNLRRVDGGVIVEHVNRHGGQESTEADLVIAADGPSSQVRKLLLPKVQRTYAGFVAWRGTVCENDASEEARETFREMLSVYKGPGTLIAMYLIPGKDGSVQPGHRCFNWVWYCNYDAASDEFSELMTDVHGRRHRFTVPASYVQPSVWTRQRAQAESILPRVFSEIVSKTSDPFVHIITDVIAPRLSLMDSKVLLVGDALAGFRPLAGSSMAQAALHALLVEQWMKGELGLEELEERAMVFARWGNRLGVELGDQAQFGHLDGRESAGSDKVVM